MAYTPAQATQNRLLSMYGYNMKEATGKSLSEFEVGDNVIVLTHKGEPVMSGKIMDMNVSENGSSALVGDRWWEDSGYVFKVM